MSLITHAQRIASRNPIHPYAWQAVYRDGGRLHQLGVAGVHTSRDVDRSRLERLVLLGHPASPIELAMPAPPPPFGPPPAEVIVQATTDLSATMEFGTGERPVRTAGTWVWLGVGYDVIGVGRRYWVLQIDPHGHPMALEGLPVIAPVACPRCGPSPGTQDGLLVPR
jgi:hypothetical protein